MGVIKRGLIGGFSGRVGSIVGSSWKGIAVIKSLPLSVANPRTSGQVAQRTAFSYTSKFASSILASYVKPLWDRFASQESGYNAFMKKNVPLYSTIADEHSNDFVISQGKMQSTDFAMNNVSADQNFVEMTWVDDSGTGLKLATDISYLVAYNATNGEFGTSDSHNTRDTGSDDVQMPSNLTTGDIINVWLAFRRADGTIVSDSSYQQFIVA